MKAAFALAAALALPACAVGAVGVATSSAVATIPFAGIATVGPARIRPLAVVEDSRCPADVQCVWAGRLRLLAAVRMAGGAESQREFILGTPQELAHGRLTLTAAAPAKIASEPLEPRAYHFTFSFVTP